MNKSWNLAFKDLTDNGQYAEAKVLLNSVTAENLSEERALGHFYSQLHFYEGQYQLAFNLAMETLDKYGSNIRLVGDIAVYQYFLDAGPVYLRQLNMFRKTFLEVQDKLSTESSFWAALNLAKLCEEQGDISFSIQLYQGLLLQDLSSDKLLRTEASLMRCWALVGNREKLVRLYRDCLFAQTTVLPRFCTFEIEHALMLTELYVLGHIGAQARLVKILNNPQFDSQEKALSYFDFLDIYLLVKTEESPLLSRTEILSGNPEPAAQFFFETEMLKIFSRMESGKALNLPDLHHLQAMRSPMDVIRILSHCASSTDHDVAEYCRKQLAFILESTPAASQKFWQSRLPEATAQEILIDAVNMILHFKSRKLELRRSPKQFLLLQLLIDSSSWACAELGEKLYGFWDATSSYDRLRMLVRAINQNARGLTGDNLIFINEERVGLLPNKQVIPRSP